MPSPAELDRLARLTGLRIPKETPMPDLPDLLGHLDDGRQAAHDQARRDNPGHDQVGCVCCCSACDEAGQ